MLCQKKKKKLILESLSDVLKAITYKVWKA